MDSIKDQLIDKLAEDLGDYIIQNTDDGGVDYILEVYAKK